MGRNGHGVFGSGKQNSSSDMTHELKTLPPFFEKVVSGEKTFEVRVNDRDYQAGDFLLLK